MYCKGAWFTYGAHLAGKMQFTSSKSKHGLLAKDEKVSRLNLYLDTPRGDVSLEEFTEIAVTRFNGRPVC